jgi:hypothetical protein
MWGVACGRGFGMIASDCVDGGVTGSTALTGALTGCATLVLAFGAASLWLGSASQSAEMAVVTGAYLLTAVVVL